jgi:hypothetical protein
MFIILSHKGNVGQNYTKIPSLLSQNSKHEENKQQMLMKMQGKRNPQTLLMGT